MATGTYAPFIPQQYFDNDGNVLSGGSISTFIAGTATPLATYSDIGLTIQNANPIPLNSAGKPTSGAIFLVPGRSYKFVFKDSSGATLLPTYDNISAIPGSAAGVDVTGTAGETLSAGQAVYLSDGSAGKQAGLWYRADSANTYSSTTPEVGIVPNAIASLDSGTIRKDGIVTGMSSLTIGAVYYIGTAGAIATTAPTNKRVIGQADTTASILVGVIPNVQIITNQVAQGRLTLTTGVPVSDATAATTVFYAPYAGNQIALYDGAAWQLVTFAQLSIAVPATTSQMYDVFVFSNAGVATLELLAWTNDTTRATALVTQDGVLCKTGALTRRYVGSCRTTTVSGQTEDSVTKRYVWNYNNRVRRPLQRFETTASWAYTTATVRQANGAAANQVDTITGVLETIIDISLMVVANNSAAATLSAGIGEDSTTTYAAGASANQGSTGDMTLTARLTKYPASVGRHFYSWNEWSTAAGATTWVGARAAVGSTITAGLSGWCEG